MTFHTQNKVRVSYRRRGDEMVERLYCYWHGDEAEKTNDCTVNLYGGVFYEVRLIEGHLAGQTRLVNAEKVTWHSRSIQSCAACDGTGKERNSIALRCAVCGGIGVRP